MPRADMQCTLCSKEFEDVVYVYDDYKAGKLECPSCATTGGMEIRYKAGSGLAVSYGYNSKGDVIARTPTAFKELMGAIKKGTSSSTIGSAIEKY
jgi:DNA-directed RNA polymerase subunit RPC12/RpoP